MSITYQYFVNSGALPPGLVLDQNSGTITGTPTQEGVYIFYILILASGIDGQTGTVAIANDGFYIQVGPGSGAGQITPGPKDKTGQVLIERFDPVRGNVTDIIKPTKGGSSNNQN